MMVPAIFPGKMIIHMCDRGDAKIKKYIYCYVIKWLPWRQKHGLLGFHLFGTLCVLRLFGYCLVVQKAGLYQYDKYI